MPKVVCEDCGELIAEGVDQAEAEKLAEQHGHGGDPEPAVDKTDGRSTYETRDEGSYGAGNSAVTDPAADEALPDADTPDTAADAGGDSSGKRSAGSADAGESDSTVADQLAAMDAMDDDRDPASWWAVSDEDDYTEVSDEYQRRYDRIQQEVERDASAIGTMLDKREELRTERERLKEHSPQQVRTAYAVNELRQYERWKRLHDDVRDAFRKLKSRNTPEPARAGSSLNMRAINQRAAGDKSRDRLFHRTEQRAKGDRAVAVSVDFSGSMSESQAKMAVMAIAEATDIIGDDLVANCWTDDGNNRFGLPSGTATLGLLCGPDEDFDATRLDLFNTGGGTPTADGIDQATDMLDGMTAREKVCLVVTDGKPNATYGSSRENESPTGHATKDAARVVRTARDDGMKVIGLGVGGVNSRQMDMMFGPDGYVMADMSDLASELVAVYRKQMRVD